MLESCRNRLRIKAAGDRRMDRHIDGENQHAMCVTLTPGSTQACTRGNISWQSDIKIAIFFSCFFLLNVTARDFLASLFLCLSFSVTLSCLPFALPVNSQLIFLLTRTVMHFCLLNVLALPVLPPVL